MQKKGLFKTNRERDQLTATIGIAGHFGRVRGMSSILPWGKAFQNNQASYKKWDRYKKDLEENMRDTAKQELIDSAGSIANVRYPIDDIQVNTPCRLVMPYVTKRNKFREVATGMAVTTHVFPKEPLLEYFWVQVVTVLDESCELDIPIDEGIEVLNIVLNNASLETSQPSDERVDDVPIIDPTSPSPPSPSPQRLVIPRMVSTYDHKPPSTEF
uniref:Uncharacterized protein n=1 Tax=Setaria viridis TaxID=4556 RepID=A0A4V6DAJ8_SETVI|nr:hypothetical protein SEVIR_2G019600v2 [Setaria viridis]